MNNKDYGFAKTPAKYMLATMFLFAVLTGCDGEKGATIRISVDNDINVCPYNVPVCVVADADAKNASNPADTAWEKYQEYLHFRPNSPVFRAMSSLLDDHRISDWRRLILLEFISAPGGSVRGGFDYSFAILSDTGGNLVWTNFAGQKSTSPQPEIRRFNADPIATDVCMATLESVSKRLPSALICDARRSSTLIILHYFERGQSPWSCAISDTSAIDGITMADTEILKKEASNQDVITAMGSVKTDAGRGFCDAVYTPGEQEKYETVRNRYAAVIAQVWLVIDKPKPTKEQKAEEPLTIQTTMPTSQPTTQESAMEEEEKSQSSATSQESGDDPQTQPAEDN